MGIDFQGRVAIVTGAGGGLGRQHALALAQRGAKVLVNDLGGAVDGSGGTVTAAQAVVDEIRAAGGEALANGASVTDFAAVEAMVQQAIDAWGRVDILVNNAGILRDKTFHKMEDADWELVYKVHVEGAYKVTRAAWEHLREQQYGRVIFTASTSGIYGNFGQSNYGMAKLGLYGLTRTLAIEGRGLVINYVSHIGDMLERTGADIGATRQVFAKAEIIEFCSAGLSRQMMELDPHNIVLCPFAISVYTLPGETQTTWVAYRQPGGAAARLVQPLLQAITDEAGQ